MHKDWRPRSFIIVLLAVHFLFCLSMVLNIPITRQVVSFLYLIFIPGFLLLKILNPEKLDLADTTLLSLGLSITFLMLIGLLINELGPIFGTSQPLSATILLIIINLSIIPLFVIGYFKNRFSNVSIPQLNLPLIVFLISLLILGISGILLVNLGGSNFLLLLTIIIIAAIVSISILSNKLLPQRYYALILIVIAIVLLFAIDSDQAPITRFLFGRGDTDIEYQAYKLTEINLHWDSNALPSQEYSGLFPTYSMISVTILPTIFSQILNLDGVWIFKILYPFLVAFMPIGAYQLYRTQVNKTTAFLATFFLLSVCVGKGWGSTKQLIAQLFYILLFLLIFNKTISRPKKNILLIIFCFTLAVSHYSLLYIFMFVIIFAWIFSAFLEKGSLSTDSLLADSGKITVSLVVACVAIAFSWYIFVSGSATFNIFLDTMNTVVHSIFTEFFNPQARGTALSGLGFVESETIIHQISKILFLLTEFFVILGFIKLLRERKKSGFNLEYRLIVLLNVAILLLNLILPKLADTFLMSRFYQTTLLIIAPLCIIGGETAIRLILRANNNKKFVTPILTLMILVPFFLFQIGFIYEVSGVYNYSLPLSMYRWDNVSLYNTIPDEQDVFGAQWLSRYRNVSNAWFYSDAIAEGHVLTSYGMIGRGLIQILSNTTEYMQPGAFIYLRRVNVVEGKIIGSATWNTSDFYSLFNNQSKVYSNGKCEIYKDNIP